MSRLYTLFVLVLFGACGCGGSQDGSGGFWRYVEGSEVGGSACIDVKLLFTEDGLAFEWTPEVCLEASAKGVQLPAICTTFGIEESDAQ